MKLNQLTKYIVSYWEARSKSGSSFDRDLYGAISRAANINGNGTNNMTAPQVGQVAYGIWKALSVKSSRAEELNQRLSEAGVDFSKFKTGESIDNIELKIISSTTKMSRGYGYGYRGSSSSTEVLKCEDPKTGIKYNVRIGNGRNYDERLSFLWQIFTNLTIISQKKKDKFYQKYPQFQNYLIHVSGKILNVSEEYKTITLNYVTLKDQLNSDELINILNDELISLK